MRNVKLLPYKMESEGAKRLAQALEVPRLRHDGSTLRGRAGIKIINWGSSDDVNPQFDLCTWVNNPTHVRIASNKLSFFQAHADFTGFIPWTTDGVAVRNWLVSGETVFARQNLTGHSGAGIVEMTPDNIDRWPQAPLYTLYVKKKSEYRVHFMNGRIFDVQKKAKKEGTDITNWKIRNLDNGFVFVRGFGELPVVVRDVCNAFIGITPLSFGAIDVIYNERNNQAYILEVNTAPGLSGMTIQNYAAEFRSYLNEV